MVRSRKRLIPCPPMRRPHVNPAPEHWSTLDELYAETHDLQTRSERIIAERRAIRRRAKA